MSLDTWLEQVLGPFKQFPLPKGTPNMPPMGCTRPKTPMNVAQDNFGNLKLGDVCARSCMCGSQRTTSDVVPQEPFTLFCFVLIFRSVSPRTRGSQIGLGWLPGSSRSPLSLLPSPGLTDVCHHAQFLKMSSGVNFSPSCLCDKHFAN